MSRLSIHTHRSNDVVARRLRRSPTFVSALEAAFAHTDEADRLRVVTNCLGGLIIGVYGAVVVTKFATDGRFGVYVALLDHNAHGAALRRKPGMPPPAVPFAGCGGASLAISLPHASHPGRRWRANSSMRGSVGYMRSMIS